MLFEQRCIVLHCLSALLQLFKHHEHVTSLVNYFELCVEGGDECRVVSEWRREGLHHLDDAGGPIDSIPF